MPQSGVVLWIFTHFNVFPVSYFSPAVVKDEPPDTWDDEEQQEKEKEKGKEEKETLRRKDRDLEFLIQEVARDGSLDDRLKRDLQSKKSESKYKEMLVRIQITIKFVMLNVFFFICQNVHCTRLALLI